MFFRFVPNRFAIPRRPMVCAIDATGLILQCQLLLQSLPVSVPVFIYLVSTVMVFFASFIFHYAPSESGFTIRFDLTALYLLIVLTILPYWNGHLAYWWVDIDWPTGNLIILLLVAFVLAYLWRPGYRSHKLRNVAIMLSLSVPPTLHMMFNGSLLPDTVWWYWFGGLSLYAAALVIYARRFRWSRFEMSHYAYYHLLLVPAVYLQSMAVLEYAGQ